MIYSFANLHIKINRSVVTLKAYLISFCL